MMLKIKIVQRVVAGLTVLLGLLGNLVLRLHGHKQRLHPEKLQMLIRSKLDSSSEMVVVDDDDDERYGLSWRLAVETNNNARPWKTVPLRCYKHVENYMTGGQYEHDLNMIVDEIVVYASEIPLATTQKYAWILDVDDTCISNIPYYKAKRFGYVCMFVYIIINYAMLCFCSVLLCLLCIHSHIIGIYMQMRSI
jgi:hypothetical protein